MDKSIPFFVYGTLIPGQPNDFYWGQHIINTTAAVYPHGRLVSLRAFPMLLEESPTTADISGVLVYVAPDHYEAVMAAVDQLEEADPENPASPYSRALREVITAAGEKITAWVYLGATEIGNNYPTIESGDWLAHLQALGSDGMTQWWQEKDEAMLFGRDIE